MNADGGPYPLDLPFATFRDLLRAVRKRQPYLERFTTQELLDEAERFIGQGSLLQFWNEFRPKYLVDTGDKEFPWELTDDARALTTKKLKRISPGTLARLKKDVVERARLSAQQTVSPMEVGQMIFFGSAIGPPKADYGDLDIVIRPIYQARYGNYANAKKGNPAWGDYNYSPEEALRKYIRNRNAFIHVTSEFDFDHLRMTGEVVYEVPDYQQRANKPDL